MLIIDHSARHRLLLGSCTIYISVVGFCLRCSFCVCVLFCFWAVHFPTCSLWVVWSCREGNIFVFYGHHTLYGVASSISWVVTLTTPLVLYHRAPPFFVGIPFFGGKFSPRILSGFSFLGHEIHILFCGSGRWLQFQCTVSRLLLSSNIWLHSFFHRRRCDGVLCGLFGIAVPGTDPRM